MVLDHKQYLNTLQTIDVIMNYKYIFPAYNRNITFNFPKHSS